MSQGYYSLIQYCPDLDRGESLNLGVVVYCQERSKLVLRMAENNQRIEQVFGDQDGMIDHARLAIRNRIELGSFRTVDDLDRFIGERANAIQLTPLRWMKILNLEQDATALFYRLVEKQDPVGAALRDRLNNRDLKLTGLFARGRTVPEIAGQLALHPGSVRRRLRVCMRRLELTGRMQLIALMLTNRTLATAVDLALSQPTRDPYERK